jgi:hypothetical protein
MILRDSLAFYFEFSPPYIDDYKIMHTGYGTDHWMR